MMESDKSAATKDAHDNNSPQLFRAAYQEQPQTPNFILPDSSNRPLTMDDIKDMPGDEVGYGRNEIFAKHGRSFTNPNYSNYFGQQSWYQPNPNFKESDLTPMEQRNVLFLHMTELTYDLNNQRAAFQADANVPAADDLEGSVIADSSARMLTSDEVSNLSAPQLRLAQNEIYARHGYSFQNPEVRNYFSQFNWYQPSSSFSAKDFSWLEERNLEMLHLDEVDRKLGGR